MNVRSVADLYLTKKAWKENIYELKWCNFQTSQEKIHYIRQLIYWIKFSHEYKTVLLRIRLINLSYWSFLLKIIIYLLYKEKLKRSVLSMKPMPCHGNEELA